MNYSSERLLDLLAPYEIVSIIGMSKNAGKTTVLNKLCAAYAGRGVTIGLTSIGRDGEESDILTATPKPRIFVAKGTVIATAAGLLPSCDITKEILRTTGINTALGEVILVRALSDGYVQLGGSAINTQIARICHEFKEFGVRRVLIDGAFNRRSVAAPEVAGAVILSSGASLHTDMAQVVRETAFATELLCLKPHGDRCLELAIAALPQTTDRVIVFDSDCAHWPIGVTRPALAAAEIMSDGFSASEIEARQPAFILIRGAVTDRIVDNLILSRSDLRNCKMIVEDSSKLLIGESTLEKLKLRRIELSVRKPIHLVALTINPVSAYGYVFAKNRFIEALREKVCIPVFNMLQGEGGEEQCF